MYLQELTLSPVPAAMRRPQLTPFLTGLIGWSCAAAVSAQGLPELARLALASDPAVAGAAAQVRAAEHRVTQARASFGPIKTRASRFSWRRTTM